MCSTEDQETRGSVRRKESCTAHRFHHKVLDKGRKGFLFSLHRFHDGDLRSNDAAQRKNEKTTQTSTSPWPQPWPS